MKNLLNLITSPVMLIGTLIVTLIMACDDDDREKPTVPTVADTVEPTVECTVESTVDPTVQQTVDRNVTLHNVDDSPETETDSIRRAMSILGKRSAEKRKTRTLEMGATKIRHT